MSAGVHRIKVLRRWVRVPGWFAMRGWLRIPGTSQSTTWGYPKGRLIQRTWVTKETN